MEEQKPNNFSEFEHLHLPYRRSLISSRIWTILGVLTVYTVIRMAIAAGQSVYLGVFFPKLLGLYRILPSPFLELVTMLILFTPPAGLLGLWLEKRRAVAVMQYYALVCLVAALVTTTVGLIYGQSLLNVIPLETILLADLYFRMREIRWVWEQKAIARPK